MYYVIITSLLSVSQTADLQWKYSPKIEFFRQNSSKYRNFTRFLLIKEGNDVSKIYCKIQDHTVKIYFKIVISNIAGLHQPPHPLTLTAHPTPG